jgi:general secretion pathway protein I
MGVMKHRIAEHFRASKGFTLLEVMIAVAVLGIAMLALLSLHHQNLMSIIHGQDLSRAAMLAQTVMTETELQRWPNTGRTSGDFNKLYPRMYPRFRWARQVVPSDMFPDVREVQVVVYYGPRFRNQFSIIEFLHDPEPQEMPNQPGQTNNGSTSPAGNTSPSSNAQSLW